ncbi:hypothetical protein ABIA35_007211 [Catenulispora sp. MAP12-49]|uniref:NB-ARC domain-containing protein n=1 Tax=Catenulispora sp. MAP12-49 TaxID=3156302 RepID=UPI0035153269
MSETLSTMSASLIEDGRGGESVNVDQPDMDVLAEQLMPYIRLALSAHGSDPDADGTKAARLGQLLLTGLLRHEPGRGQFEQAVAGLAEDCDDLEAQSVLSAHVIRILSEDAELAAELAGLVPEAAGFTPKVMTEVVDADLVARGTSPFAVTAEEDGSACTVVALTDPESGFAALASVTPAAGVIGLSAEGERSFVGRQEQIRAMAAALEVGAAVGLTGLGGTGKSSLAEHYALSRQEEFDLVCRIAAPDPQALETGLATLAAQIYPAIADVPMAVAAQWSRGWLATHDRWLVVLDDVTDPEHVARLVRDHDRGRFLLTSRHAEGWNGVAEPVRLGALDPAEAIELFTRVAGGRTTDLDGVSELCEELGRLALAAPRR